MPRMLSLPRRFLTDELKGNSCSQITNCGPWGCAPSEAEHVSAEQRAQTKLIQSIHNVYFSSPLQLAISLWSRYRALCCQQEGKRIKRPQLLQHSIAWGERHKSWNGDSSGKAPRREQPLIASPHPCHSHHWSTLLFWDFSSAWELNILNLTRSSGSEGTVSISSSVWFLVEQ